MSRPRTRSSASVPRTAIPIGIAVTTAVALLALWCGPLAAHIPRPVRRLAPDRDCLVITGPGAAPLFCNRRLDEIETLFAGDSRASYDLRAELLEDAGFASTGILWGPGATLADVLDAVEQSRAQRVVLALSTMGFYARGNETTSAIAASPPPDLGEDLAGAGLEDALERWRVEQADALVATGLPRAHVEVGLLGWSEKYRADHHFDRVTPRTIDRSLGDWLDLRRSLAIPVIEPGAWRDGWFDVADPQGVNRASRKHFAPETRARRAAAIAALTLRVADLEKAREVVCVRLPMSPSLLAIEEEALASEAFAAFCEAAGVPFLDYSTEPYTTFDGTHLTEFEARRLTRVLADDLRGLWSP